MQGGMVEVVVEIEAATVVTDQGYSQTTRATLLVCNSHNRVHPFQVQMDDLYHILLALNVTRKDIIQIFVQR